MIAYSYSAKRYGETYVATACNCTRACCNCLNTNTPTAFGGNQIVFVIIDEFQSLRSRRERELEDLTMALKDAAIREAELPRHDGQRFRNQRKTVHHRAPAFRRPCY